jgi:predicted AlkP superfamily pyrophosphatase or phosphodiesterase
LKTPRGAPDAASRWILEAAKWIEEKYAPTLNLIYLPHLDYNLQRFGPGAIAEDLRLIDNLTGDLLEFFDKQSVQTVLLSEYGISAVDEPLHLNRLFRQQGWLAIKDELGLELLDCGASRVFAVADHQIAHVYCNDTSLKSAARALLERTPGIAEVWDSDTKAARGLAHPRAGDLIAIAGQRAWFTYYYWLDDARAPDFARTVDIHRKPGYDPVELFLDPATPLIKMKISWRLLQKKLGFRMLMDVIPLDARLVKGSHGRQPVLQDEWPVLLTSRPELVSEKRIESTAVFEVLRRHVLEG